MRRPAKSPGGFLKVLPRLRTPYGWVRLRSAWTASVRRRTAVGSSLATAKRPRSTTCAARSWRKRESRYAKPQSAAA